MLEPKEFHEDPSCTDANYLRDPYAYTKRNEFTSETIKLEVGGFGRRGCVVPQMKKLMKCLGIKSHKIKGTGKNSPLFITFKDEEERNKAMEKLNGFQYKGSALYAKIAQPAKDPLISKWKLQRQSCSLDVPVKARVAIAVASYHEMPYEEQLRAKQDAALAVMKKFGNKLNKVNPELCNWIYFHKLRKNGQVCDIDPIVPSPVQKGYRNKCEFTVGTNSESSKPVVGFRVSSYKEGSIEVAPVDELPNISAQMKVVCKSFQEYLALSPYEPYDPVSHRGVWRQLTVRTSNNNDVLVIIVIHPQDLEEGALSNLKRDVGQYLTEGDGRAAGVTSILFQVYGQKKAGDKVECEHWYGPSHITETILGCSFKVSPEAFLQVNTEACEELYRKVKEVCHKYSNMALLDVCCGVGTIGICAGEGCGKILGIDTVAEAIENAKENAKNNSVKNASYYCGRAEDYMDKLVTEAAHMDCIAIVDPPRSGLHNGVLSALRRCGRLHHIVYLSCNPPAAMENFLSLCRPKSKNIKGSFFVPIRAIPVDMFPDTPHYELIVLFERFDAAKWNRIMEGKPSEGEVDQPEAAQNSEVDDEDVEERDHAVKKVKR